MRWNHCNLDKRLYVTLDKGGAWLIMLKEYNLFYACAPQQESDLHLTKKKKRLW